jgi:3-hydroxyisobutyrate dehydrogenase
MNVGFAGMGTMGASMALNIMKAGHDVTVWNRTREREEPVAAQGAKRAATPKELAQGKDIIVVCVSDTPDVEAVVLGDDGVIHGASDGQVLVDCSTISPDATRHMAEQLAGKGVKWVDAPVSGGPEGAAKGTLTIMVGGDADDVERVRPILDAMGQTITHVGPLGAGQVTKAINQVIIAGTYMSVAEGVVLGLKAGLDMPKVVQALSTGAAGSWILDNRAINMIKNDYPLGFRTKLHHKDLNIALEAAKQMGATMPVTALMAQLENGLISRGKGDEDVSNVARCFRELAGLD